MLSKENYPYESWAEKFPNNNVNIKSLLTNNEWNFIFKDNEKDIQRINKYIMHCLKSTDKKVKIYPYPDLIFNAFRNIIFNNIKAVIIGQDPYHNNEMYNGIIIPQAMGLSFSIPMGIKIPSSLQNIFKNQIKFGHISSRPNHGNLINWVNQGCLMLNTSLTVQHGHPNSHAKFWTKITDNIISKISSNCDNIVFVLWGAPALKKLDLIDTNKHKVTISSHPSGLSYNKPLRNYESFMNTDHFGVINKHLKKVNKKLIKWSID